MNWSDYEAVWKRQPLPRGVAADVTALRESFATETRKLHAAMVVRDYAEAAAGLVGAISYGVYWWQVGRNGWPMFFAIALILGVSSRFIAERFRVRRLRRTPAATLLDKVDADIAELLHQCGLLRSLWSWYLTPCALAMAIHYVVIVRRTAAWDPLRQPWFGVGVAVFFGGILVFAWLINRHALRTRLMPRLAELEKLRGELAGAAH